MLAIAVGSEVAHFRKRIESEFRAVLGGFAQRLDELGALADGMTVTTATDILWTLNHPDTWYLLVYGCGWTTDRYEKRVGDTLTTQLLRDRDTTRKLSSRKNTGSG